ncbi:FkbM family methyltransferase [Bradyrhizobium vignae]|uniref:Putative Methyltransferase FkbM n=1 Tax=Bradyrhizobium vignae TaxID=1549949 RepID=A0A2U3PXT3_9BRAD|nr:FkbM family methyltransferase [Bradyrhizobium vignae]SPP93919.1 putative Methyltransferase FkbM [Bradyrhizobium vignae]
MKLKAMARFCYAHVPGLAAVRFAVKDAMAPYLTKPEYQGACRLAIESGLIVDIGANRGQSIAAFRRLAPKSQIVAFEPEPSSAQRLSVRYEANPNVKIYNCALGAEHGTMTLFVPCYGRWNCDGMAATDHAAATDWLRDKGRMYHFNEAKLTVTKHLIECATLDSYGTAPRLIKLHAQGAEPAILRGSKRTIEQHRPALMCAFPSREVNDLLTAWGYRPYIYSRRRFIPGVAQPHVTFTWYLREAHLTQLAV